MEPTINVQVLRLEHGSNLDLPRYETPGSAGMDLMAAIEEPINLSPSERALVPTGLAVAIPDGYEGQVRPRSGLAIKHGVTCVNSPGTIDSDYRGEIKVILVNLGTTDYQIEPGSRIAQIIFSTVSKASWRTVLELPESSRGSGGFGHTGE